MLIRQGGGQRFDHTLLTHRAQHGDAIADDEPTRVPQHPLDRLCTDRTERREGRHIGLTSQAIFGDG